MIRIKLTDEEKDGIANMSFSNLIGKLRKGVNCDYE
jgi:hypothetical protein